jgi:hypothetical protein
MTDDDSFAAERWVRIMCDYSAEGVWHKDGSGDSAAELPVDAALIERILRWQAWYETALDENFDVDAFSAEGLAIAKAVKAALPEWTVVYFDEARADLDAPRDTYEYEIHADQKT